MHIHVCVCVQGGGMHAGNHGDGEVLRLIRGTHTQKVAGAVDWVCVRNCLSVERKQGTKQCVEVLLGEEKS